MFAAIKLWFVKWSDRWSNRWSDRCEAARRRQISKDLQVWRHQLDTGKCRLCGGQIYVFYMGGVGGHDLIMCEHQYINPKKLGKYAPPLLGKRNCLNVADVTLLNEAAASIGEEPVYVS